MRVDKKREFIKRIAALAGNVGHTTMKNGQQKTVARDDTIFSIIDKDLDEYNNIIYDLLKEDRLYKKISEKYASDSIDGLIAEIKKNGSDNIQMDFNQLIDDFKSMSSEERTTYLPLFGIELEEDCLEIGKIKLKKMNEDRTKRLKTKIKENISKTTNTPEDKSCVFENECKKIDKYVLNNVCAEHTICAEPIRALEMVVEETESVIDLLRFTVPVIYPPGNRVVIGIQGEYSYQTRYVLIISKSLFNSNLQRIGALSPLTLSSENLSHMDEMGMSKLDELIKKESLNDLEKALLLSLKWLSRSQTQIDNQNKLINLITTLETLLSPSGREAIGKSIAEGVAVLVEKEDSISRKKTSKFIKQCYNGRSTLSHGGTKNISDYDIYKLTIIACRLITQIIKRKDEFNFTSKEDLENWIEFIKFGGTSDIWRDYQTHFF